MVIKTQYAEKKVPDDVHLWTNRIELKFMGEAIYFCLTLRGREGKTNNHLTKFDR